MPQTPNGLSAEEAQRQSFPVQIGNRLILFEYGGALGFIEPLHGAHALMEQLRAGQRSHSITAVAVGELGEAGIPPGDLSAWPPIGVLPLLSLATGVEVGAPWVEFRDESGGLTKRLHTRFLARPYSAGKGAIPDVNPQAIGYLLTKAFLSHHFDADHFRVALRNWRRAGQTGNLYERFRYLSTAFESLLAYHGLKTTRLRDALSPAYRSAVDVVLRDAAQKLRKAADQAAAEGLLEDHGVLTKIGSKVINSANIDADFGIRVAELVKRYGLADPEIIDSHILQHPRTDGCETWSDVLSMYRGAIVHEGFLDFRNTVDRNEAYRLALHLQDVLARILLKMAGYDHEYQPAFVVGTAPRHVDWVKSTTRVADLGLP